MEPGRDDPGNGGGAAQSVAQAQQNIAHSQQRHIGAQGHDGIACAAEEQTQQQGLFVAPAQKQRAGKQCAQKAEQIFQAKRQREAGPGDAQPLRNGQDKQAAVVIGQTADDRQLQQHDDGHDPVIMFFKKGQQNRLLYMGECFGLPYSILSDDTTTDVKLQEYPKKWCIS